MRRGLACVPLTASDRNSRRRSPFRSVATRSPDRFDAAADVLAGRVRPGMTLRIPLGDDQAIRTDAVIGVTLGVVLD